MFKGICFVLLVYVILNTYEYENPKSHCHKMKWYRVSSACKLIYKFSEMGLYKNNEEFKKIIDLYLDKCEDKIKY